MTPTDVDAFGALLGGLAETFRVDLTPAMLDAYFGALEDLELITVQQAIARAIRYGDRFPIPKQLRKFAGWRGQLAGYDGHGHALPTLRQTTKRLLAITEDR